jgi:hypothetical protein
MGRIQESKILPGGMITDVHETELGEIHHQLVRNLIMDEDKLWKNCQGALEIVDGIVDNTSGIEVTEDRSGSRFLLFQDGTSIKRLDYDSGDGNGYENETASTLTLPSGVTISATAVLNFFYFRGVVRILGASEPLYYAYINRTFFYGDDSFSETGWILEKQAIQWPVASNDLEVIGAVGMFLTEPVAADEYHALFVKFFYVFDNGQYELIKKATVASGVNPVTTTSLLEYGQDEELNTGKHHGIGLKLRVNGSALKDNMFNKRVTGIGVALAHKQAGDGDAYTVDSYLQDKEPFYVKEIIPIGDDDAEPIDPLVYVWEVVRYDNASPTNLQIADPATSWPAHSAATYLNFQDGYLGVGVDLEISYDGTTISTSITAIADFDDATQPPDITVADSLATLFSSTTGNYGPVSVKILRKWQYDASDGYFTYIGVDFDAIGTLYDTFTGINQFSKNITPNFDQMEVIEGRSYVKSLETDEEDAVRYSPIDQLDVLPIGNLIQSEVGDSDSIKAIGKIDNRLAIIKENSVGYGNFSGGSYTESIGKEKKGMYPTYGWTKIDDIILIMDREDVFLFNGITAIPVLENQLLRNYYKEHVDVSSRPLFNKLDNEVWMVLGGGKILVWRRRHGKNYFYERQYNGGTNPLYGFLDSEQKMMLATATSFETVNHSLTSWNESLSVKIESRILGGMPFIHFRKVKDFLHYIKSNSAVTFTFKDESQSPQISKSHVESSGFSAGAGRYLRDWGHPLFKEPEIDIEIAASTSLNFEMKFGIFRSETWKTRASEGAVI